MVRYRVSNMVRPSYALALLLVCGLAHAEPNALGVKPLPSENLENLFSMNGKVFSGSSPHDEQGFLELKKLGIKTIISVDGGKPDLETARKHGFRYIHLPMGYDGASPSNANRILKAAESSQGPIYVHCHHGKHRGPAAAAVICQGLGMWNTNQSVSWMKQAGTSPNYPGLFAMATEFKKSPDYEKIPNDFPEEANVSGLVDAMVEIDEHWGHLKGIQKAGYKVPSSHPDLVPTTEATLLMEAFRELQRSKDAKDQGADFLERLKAAEQEAAEVHAFLKQNNGGLNDAAPADRLWSKVGQSCATCHKKYRN